MNGEALLVAYLNGLPGRPAEAFMDVPRDRPARFITVERTGGPREHVRELPMYAVQCWAESRWQASELARVTADNLEALVSHPAVGRVTVSSTYNFPSPDGEPRYQLVVELVTV